MAPWRDDWSRSGLTPASAEALFHQGVSVSPLELIGEWRGSELPTGHPLDGLLPLYGWIGKRFRGLDEVDPLVFEHNGVERALDPGKLPLGLALALPRMARTEAAVAGFRLMQPLLAASVPKARLRAVALEGVVSAAMIYDDLPIIDYFRRISPTRLIGRMEFRRTRSPFFFTLVRRSPSAA